MNRILPCLAVISALATPALAYDREEIGTIDADFGGEAIALSTFRVTQGEEVSITAFLQVIGQISFLSLTGTGTGDDNARIDISVNFFTDAPDAETPVFDLEISYAPTGTEQHWSADGVGEANSVTFTTLSYEGGEGHATGTFSALLCYTDGYDEAADTGNCRPVEGSFDTPFEVEE